ncbi:MAG: DUF362 domain-containing protein [bacterium]|nr:DUF362 domain-containing protein [bacterium]
MLDLLAKNGIPIYQSPTSGPWRGPSGLIARDDVVLIKVNCQWRCRGATNTDVLRGLIYRILLHPDGFTGEVVIMENGQGRGAFDGISPSPNSYGGFPELTGVVRVNSEDETLTINEIVQTVFAGQPVCAVLMDGFRNIWLSASDHVQNGYRKTGTGALVSYPCFTTARGNRIELKEGRWTGTDYAQNVKLINIPVLKDHGGSGMTGVLKHTYGILSMSDGTTANRHYADIGSQVGKMWTQVRIPDLNLLDCIWVSHEALGGYPVDATRRCNILLAGVDPVAMDYYASKHILLPLGGTHGSWHDPDQYAGLVDKLDGAMTQINSAGGIAGSPVRMGDANIEVIARSAVPTTSNRLWTHY